MAAAAAMVLAACGTGPGGDHPCTLIGAESGAGISLDQLPPALRAGQAKACVDQSCVTEDLSSGIPVLFVRDDTLTSPRSVTIHLTITDPSTGTVLFDDQLTAPVRIVTPNGPSCPPTAYQISVRAGADGTLELQT